MKKRSAPEELVTKKYLDNALDHRLDKLKQEIKLEMIDLLRQLRDEFFNKIDPVISEIEDAREDREIGAYQMTELKKVTDNHESRLKSLESIKKH